MTHLRYIVYKDSDTQKKEIVFWADDILHSTYARQHNIAPQNLLSVGYMRPTITGWIPYEHYQLDEGNPKIDRILARKAFQTHTELQTPELAEAVQQTYLAEKKMFYLLLKTAVKKFLKSVTR